MCSDLITMTYDGISGEWMFSKYAQQHLYMTCVLLVMFFGGKILYERIRRKLAQTRLVIVGAGPIGLTTALISLKTGKISSVSIYETYSRVEVINRSYQVTFDPQSVTFLSSVGLDFNGIEGCWSGECFYTTVGVYVEYLLEKLQYRQELCRVHFNTRVSSDVISYCCHVYFNTWVSSDVISYCCHVYFNTWVHMGIDFIFEL